MTLKNVQTVLAAIACIAMVSPRPVLASEPRSLAKDVALRPGGVLVGQITDQQGAGLAGTKVSIWQNEREVVTTATDANGVFAAQGLRGGQYQLITAEGHQTLCRFWAPETAPPAATDSVMLVTGDNLVRGQWGPPAVGSPSWAAGYGGRWLDWVRSHPYITAGVVAAAIAAPIAVAASDDDDNGPSS